MKFFQQFITCTVWKRRKSQIRIDSLSSKDSTQGNDFKKRAANKLPECSLYLPENPLRRDTSSAQTNTDELNPQERKQLPNSLVQSMPKTPFFCFPLMAELVCSPMCSNVTFFLRQTEQNFTFPSMEAVATYWGSSSSTMSVMRDSCCFSTKIGLQSSIVRLRQLAQLSLNSPFLDRKAQHLWRGRYSILWQWASFLGSHSLLVLTLPSSLKLQKRALPSKMAPKTMFSRSKEKSTMKLDWLSLLSWRQSRRAKSLLQILIRLEPVSSRQQRWSRGRQTIFLTQFKVPGSMTWVILYSFDIFEYADEMTSFSWKALFLQLGFSILRMFSMMYSVNSDHSRCPSPLMSIAWKNLIKSDTKQYLLISFSGVQSRFMRQMKVGSSSPLGQSSNSRYRISMFSWESMDIIRSMCSTLECSFSRMCRFRFRYWTRSLTVPTDIVISLYRIEQKIRTSVVNIILLSQCQNREAQFRVVVEGGQLVGRNNAHVRMSRASQYINQVQLQMGTCFSQSQHSARAIINKKPNPHNPINKIIDLYDTNDLQERWKRNQLKIVKNKMNNLEDNIKFVDFQQLFPKIKDFSQPTQRKIYKLFSYENNRDLSKKELFKALTIIRKVDKNELFAPFIFYVYTKDQRHQAMDQAELELFKTQNETHRRDGSNDDELEEHFEEEREPKLMKLAVTSPKGAHLDVKPSEKKLYQSSFNKESQHLVCIADFVKIFQGYDLLSYQIMFSWDQEEEELQLLARIEKQGIVRKKGDKVNILDYKWWLEWTTYVQQRYNKRIELSGEDQIQNYNSTKIQKRFSLSKIVEHNKSDTPYPAPGEIKNQSLLSKTKERGTELLPNLVELDNIICLPEDIWNKLILIYHGGPPIERIYPQIYRRFVLKAAVSPDGKFIPKQLKKYINKEEGSKIHNLLIDRQARCVPYYKHPGELDWKVLDKDPKVVDQVFNYQRTFLVMVPKAVEKEFRSNYNVEERKGGKYLKKRFKNYGSEINISVEGVLTRAEVTQIISHDQIKVLYLNLEGSTESAVLRIDENMELLNPQNLDRVNQINELPGLSNLGNTCYMNAVLQCLIRTPYFGRYLQQDFFEGREKDKGEKELLLEQIGRLYNDSKSSRQDTVSTTNFKKVFDKHCPFFQGNLQHDAQQFLICLLERISEEIKIKKEEYGISGGTEHQSDQDAKVNKKIVKFFSGKTQAITYCLKCRNRNIREEPFFTYSLSLPELKETQYFYFYVESSKTANLSVPVRYGVTLDRKATVQSLITAISKIHRKPMDNLALYTVFNNEILSLLEPRIWQSQVAHYLSFNVKLVCYEIQYMYSPTYYHYREKKLSQKSVKIQLRQRIYSEKTQDYRIVYLPFVLEVTNLTKWDDLMDQVDLVIKKLASEEPLTLNSTPLANNKEVRVSNSGLREGELSIPPIQGQSSVKDGRQMKDGSRQMKDGKPYKIRVIKTDQYYQNNCVFCKDQFVLTNRSRSTRTCRGLKCTFNRDSFLFDDQQFRNINDLIIITVDWQENLPNNVPLFLTHRSYEDALQRTESRKDRLEDLISSNFKTTETLELRCQKKECGHQLAERIEKISVSPNILLLHLKRFRYEDNRLVKLTNNVEYPQMLTLPGTNDQYELFGVAVHLGSGVGGHYISYVKVNKKWYLCDDTKVRLAAHRQHIDNNAYLLFYHKIDFEPSLICLSF